MAKYGRKQKSRTTKSSTRSNTLAANAYAAKAADVEIEEEPTLEGGSFQDHLIWFYGPPKIGKSKLLSLFEGVYFITTEPGFRWLKLRKTRIPNWATFIKFIKKLEKNPKLVKTMRLIVVDTVDNLAKFCMQYVCGREGIAHPTDQEWGKGWEAYRDEFAFWIMRLCSLNPGVAFISHESVREVISKSMKITKHTPALPKTAFTLLNNLCDIIIHFSFATEVKGKREIQLKETRCLYTKPEISRDAGDRTGLLPDRITFKREATAVKKIMECFS